MADIVDKATRSRMMSSIKGKDTLPERVVRQYLHASGLRYRLHKKNLPGKPDIVLPKYKTAIFIQGCFWHRHEGCTNATTPATNTEFWLKKFADNVARDGRNQDALKALGWKVIIIWECQITQTALLELVTSIKHQ